VLLTDGNSTCCHPADVEKEKDLDKDDYRYRDRFESATLSAAASTNHTVLRKNMMLWMISVILYPPPLDTPRYSYPPAGKDFPVGTEKGVTT
jgi:hypothetical protein